MKETVAIISAVLAVLLLPGAVRCRDAGIPQAAAERQRKVADELNAADCAYSHDKSGEKLVEAQRHVERALEIDPANRRAMFFLARVLYARLSNGADDVESNKVAAHRVIAAYKRILQREPDNEEAYRVITGVLGATGEDENGQPDPKDDNRRGMREWIKKRAFNASLPNVKRAHAFLNLADEWLECSRNIPGLSKDEPGAGQKADALDAQEIMERSKSLDQARKCASEHLAMADYATGLDPQNDQAWYHRASALRQLAMLAGIDGNSSQKEDFSRRAGDAEKQARLVEEAQRGSGRAYDTGLGNDMPPYNLTTLAAAPDKIILPTGEEEGIEAAETTQIIAVKPGAGYEQVVSAGVLNDRAISRPEPSYPTAARKADASAVRVRVIIDESGKVMAARALAGHVLLREAAVAAARRAVFAQTRLRCVPVKVTGVLVYEFTNRRPDVPE